MASVINTNMASLVAQRNLSSSQSALATSVARLSSGVRINSARDDAAGLGISQVLTQQIKGLNTSIRNAGDAISVIQTAEGASAEISNILQRMKELAAQGQNDSLSEAQQGSLGDEIDALASEIDAITARTTFNGRSFINGEGEALTFQTGAYADDVFEADFSDGNENDIDFDLTADTLGVSEGDYSTSGFATLEGAIDEAINTVATARGQMGAWMSQLDSAINNMQATSANLAAANSRILDTDYAAETATLTKGQILQQAGAAMLAQANQMPNVILSLLK
ncbi:MAG: hypothetical protein RIR70_1571 [Pseudomonadota bacterium]|jgi:flagellin